MISHVIRKWHRMSVFSCELGHESQSNRHQIFWQKFGWKSTSKALNLLTESQQQTYEIPWLNVWCGYSRRTCCISLLSSETISNKSAKSPGWVVFNDTSSKTAEVHAKRFRWVPATKASNFLHKARSECRLHKHQIWNAKCLRLLSLNKVPHLVCHWPDKLNFDSLIFAWMYFVGILLYKPITIHCISL